jgi:hypothetical protein
LIKEKSPFTVKWINTLSMRDAVTNPKGYACTKQVDNQTDASWNNNWLSSSMTSSVLNANGNVVGTYKIKMSCLSLDETNLPAQSAEVLLKVISSTVKEI